jgi:hypothetical protein
MQQTHECADVQGLRPALRELLCTIVLICSRRCGNVAPFQYVVPALGGWHFREVGRQKRTLHCALASNLCSRRSEHCQGGRGGSKRLTPGPWLLSLGGWTGPAGSPHQQAAGSPAGTFVHADDDDVCSLDAGWRGHQAPCGVVKVQGGPCKARSNGRCARGGRALGGVQRGCGAPCSSSEEVPAATARASRSCFSAFVGPFSPTCTLASVVS